MHCKESWARRITKQASEGEVLDGLNSTTVKHALFAIQVCLLSPYPICPCS